MSHPFTAAFVFLIGCLVIGMPGEAVAQDEGHPQKVLGEFGQHVAEHAQFADARKDEVSQLIEELSDDPQYAITDSLIVLFPPFADAIALTDGDDVEAAIEALTPLTESDDNYLAADATFYLARTLMNREQFEAAMPLLEQLQTKLAKYSANKGTAQYYVGVAQAGLLDNAEAIESFMQFLQFNPEAPERLRVSAWRQVQQLQSVESGKLTDVYQRMDYSRRRLKLAETGEQTQTQQDKIVNMLTKLIKEEEKKECSNCKGGKSGKPKPGEKPQQAQSKPSQSKSQSGGNSSNPNGQALDKKYADIPASPWSRLRDRSRDPANNAVKEKLPARYRAIFEKYVENANGGK